MGANQKKKMFLSRTECIFKKSLSSSFLFLLKVSEWVSISSVNTSVQLKYSCTSSSNVPLSTMITGSDSQCLLLLLRKRLYHDSLLTDDFNEGVIGVANKAFHRQHGYQEQIEMYNKPSFLKGPKRMHRSLCNEQISRTERYVARWRIKSSLHVYFIMFL